jgi:4-diphosphocytidyl-2-C-methyl-D-erythritol kinase
MNTLTLPAPAKLNLSLRILGRRDDGFHELDTLMVKLPGLTDRLDFVESGAFTFHCDEPGIPGDGTNLVVKAVRAYESAIGQPCNFSITLKKNIPHGAGLGGGSSDAAVALMGLNQLHNDKLKSAELHEIAASIGSDVPFFLKPGAARCTGRGEILAPAPAPEAWQVLLLKPWFGVATADAYGRWADSKELPGIDYSPQKSADQELVNDLERPVFEKHRFLAELKQWLLARDETSAALLAGSGATVFAVLRDGADAAALARCARHELDPGLWAWHGQIA